jgi:hypothetical protein
MSILKQVLEFFNGKDLTPLWEQFAREKNGIVKSTSGDLFVEYPYLNFTFKIANYTYYITSGGKTYERKYMIGIVEFIHPTQLEICITKEDLFTRIGKIFKNKEILIGNKNFDNKFYIKSNKEFKAIGVLKDKLLIEKITSINPTRIEITNKDGLFGEFPSKDKFMLYYAKQERFENISQLNQIDLLLTTFIENLKENCSIH